MQIENIDEPLLTKFLLGKLTEEEQVQVEDWAFADRQHMAALDGAEAELIDAYVRGDLARGDRRAFERLFLASPQRRSKVEFAQALAKVSDEMAKESPVSKPDAGWLAWWKRILSWNPTFRLAGAMATVICISTVSWLSIQNASMRSRVAALETQRRDLDSLAQGLRQDLRNAQTRAEGLAAKTANPSPAEGARAPLIASLVLMAGPSRAESRVDQLVLDRGTQIAHVEIPLEPRDEYPRYRIDLHTRSGKEILAISGLVRRRARAGDTISFDLPASSLSTGEYELALRGLRDGEPTQDIGYYYFRVQKR